MLACTRPHKHNDVYGVQVSAKVHNHIYVVEPLLDDRRGKKEGERGPR